MPRNVIRRAGALLDDPARFTTLAAAVLAETAVRAASGFVHPTLVVLLPPVTGVAVLARRAGVDRPARPTSSGEAPPGRVGSVLPRSLLATVLAHAVALLVGTGLFLVVDTGARYAIYAAGAGPLPAGVVYYGPLLGVGVGTVVAWGLLVPAVARVTRGASIREAAGVPASVLLSRPRTALSVAAAHLGIGLLLAATVAVAVFVATSDSFTAPPLDRTQFLLASGVLGAFAGILGLVVLVPPQEVLAERVPGDARVPVARLALALLLFGALVGGAAGLRVTETRPLAAEPAPLPDAPDAAYATALENTEGLNHNLTVVYEADGAAFTSVLDRRDRQYLQVSAPDGDTLRYYSGPGTVGSDHWFGPAPRSEPVRLGSRTVGEWELTASPDFFDRIEGAYSLTGERGLPRAGTGDWTTVERGDGELVVSLTDPDAVFEALEGQRMANVTYREAAIRMRIDADRGVVVGGRARLNASVGEHRVDRDERYVVRAGADVDVSHPDPAGPSAGEWVWRLFAY